MANHFSNKKKRKGGVDKEGERRTSLPPFSRFNLGYQETTLPFLLYKKKKRKEKEEVGGINKLQITARALSCKDEGFIRIFEITKTPNF